METRLIAILALILMMIQPTLEGVTLGSETVVGNILFENAAMIPLVIIMLIVALMI